MSTHTPGPWKSLPLDGYTIIVGTSDDGERNEIATSYSTHPQKDCAFGQAEEPWHKEQSANARLIAAAPDMLAALKECQSFCRGHQETPEKAARYQRVLAAIAKAEGLS